MGGIITPTKEEEIMKLLRQDESKKLQEFISDNQLTPDILYTKHKRTLLQLCCYYDSVKCLSKLIEMNYDYNQVENSNGNTPLFIACKYNCSNLVQILLSKDDCKKLVKNKENLNEFDIAFLRGNYSICYYLLYVYKNKEKINNDINNKEDENINNIDNDNIETNMNINKNKREKNNYDYDINQIYQNYFFNNNFDIDYFMSLQNENKYPLFNMSLFFKSLCQKTPPKDCQSFAPERKKTKELMTKIPDPNETWGHFFKRMVNMELYNPPMVDKKSVSQMNSIYMNTQMKLIENEYGVKLNYYNPNNDNGGNLDEEETPILEANKKNNVNNIENDNDIIENGNNNIENEEEQNGGENNNNIENGGKIENIFVINIKENSSERNINNINKNDE